jgi:CheY-specific phosphatase CheX
MSIQSTVAIHNADAAVLRAHVVHCTREAFAAYSIHIDLDEGDACELAHDAQIVTFIGFGGAQMRGTLTVMAPQILWLETYPIAQAPGNAVGDNDLLDWCGEVVNQILGRIKNQLRGRGIELEVSTPKAVHASQLTISRSAQQSVCMLRSSAKNDSAIGVWFDAVVDKSVVLFAAPGEAPPPGDLTESMIEGDLILF